MALTTQTVLSVFILLSTDFCPFFVVHCYMGFTFKIRGCITFLGTFFFFNFKINYFYRQNASGISKFMDSILQYVVAFLLEFYLRSC